jgi:hypothetical protein
MMPDFEQLHTCRDVSSLLGWFDGRPNLAGKTRVDIAKQVEAKSRDKGRVG